MQKKSLKTSSVVFVVAVCIQIFCVAGSFYFQQSLKKSRVELENVQGIEREFFKVLSGEGLANPAADFSGSELAESYDTILDKIAAIHKDLGTSLIQNRKQLLSDISNLAAEKTQRHEIIRSQLSPLTSSIAYIHDHHITQLKNMINQGGMLPDYDPQMALKEQRDYAAPETDIIKAAINVQSSMLNIFETFSKLQLGVSPSIISSQFSTAVQEFYQAINAFEDSSLDAQDGILIEELLINGQAFETSFNRFLQIETRIRELRQKLSVNKEKFIQHMEDEKEQLNLMHSALDLKMKSLQYLLLATFTGMFFLLIWSGYLLVQGFRRMLTETNCIQKDIGYKIPYREKDFKEFDVVFKALNAMGDTIQSQVTELKDAKQKLEKRVQNRTFEISTVNNQLKKEIQERIELEKRLIQGSKMEAIGRLSGGIAHDFNNILSGIMGYSQLAREHTDDPVKLENYFVQILNGTQRAAALIQQILTVSRQAEIKKGPIQLSIVIKEAIKLIRSSIPTSIEVKQSLSSNAMVMADATQMHQVVMNLCTNAYHAMKVSGGTLSVELADIEILEASHISGFEMSPGNYLELVVSDTGEGMDKTILNKIFDPYFTTKKIGEGTGLGLSVVYGIVEEHSGAVKAESIRHKGSEFTVFLPIFEDIAQRKDELKEKQSLPRGTEKIMIVDDEENVLMPLREFLEDYGYTVADFLDPEAARRAFEADPKGFDLLITDMTMPKLTGDRLARACLKQREDLPVIISTGYHEGFSREKALEMGMKMYLQKPVSGDLLLNSVRQVLDTHAAEKG